MNNIPKTEYYLNYYPRALSSIPYIYEDTNYCLDEKITLFVDYICQRGFVHIALQHKFTKN